MSATQYFDLFTEYQPVDAIPARPVFAPALPVTAHTAPLAQREAKLILNSIMFTGRVPLSTWTFTIALGDKLWVSDRTSLYFGKETPLGRLVYQDSLPVAQHRVSLEVSISAYNNYGDVLGATRMLRFCDAGDNMQPGALFQLEDNWMQLLFKFRLAFAESLHG